MKKQHRSFINIQHWKEVRETVANLSPALAKIIDSLNPDKRFPLFKAHYSFGSKIFYKEQLYLPTSSGESKPITSEKIDNKIRSHLKRRPFPASLILNHSAERFYEINNRIASKDILHPGRLLGLSNQLDAKQGPYGKYYWNLVSGLRTLYMLPKITNSNHHKFLIRKYHLQSQVPQNYSQHWKIFSEIANCSMFEENWHTEILFFSDSWFEQNRNNPKWNTFYTYILQQAWQDSFYRRNKQSFEILWEEFLQKLMERNIIPNLYLHSLLKQVVLTGFGLLPGLTVATNDHGAPINTLQKTYIEDYKLKEYNPIIMQSHLFSFDDDHPTYFSIPYSNVLENTPTGKNTPNISHTISEIRHLMELFKEITFPSCDRNHSLLSQFHKQVQIDYFHQREDKYNHILSTEILPNEDKRLSTPPKGCGKNTLFPSASHVINGCVRFKRKDS